MESILTHFQSKALAAGLSPPRFEEGRLCTFAFPGQSAGLLLAEVGGYQLAVDSEALGPPSVLGLVLFRRQGIPCPPGLAWPIPAQPAGPTLGGHCGRALTLGPAYKEADGRWQSLADMNSSWCDAAVVDRREEASCVSFAIEYRVGGGPVILEQYQLTAEGLVYETRIAWVVGGFRLHLPAPVTDGKRAGIPECSGHVLRVRFGSHTLLAAAGGEWHSWEFEGASYATAAAIYQSAFLQGRSSVEFKVKVSFP